MLSEFALEVWIKYAIAAPIMIARFILRLYVPGRRDFDGTDVWCALATVRLPGLRKPPRLEQLLTYPRIRRYIRLYQHATTS